MAAQVQWFGLKPILIDSISGYCISNDFSMNSNKFSRLTGPSGPIFLARNLPKICIFLQKWRLKVNNWLETILIGYISGYYISNDFSMNSNKFNRLTGPSWP